MTDDIPAGVGRLGGSPVFTLGILVLLLGGIAGVAASLVHEWLDDDYDAELVALSLAILADDYAPQSGETMRLRQYALDALEQATGAALSDAERDRWLAGREQLLPAGLCVAQDSTGQ